MTLLISGLVVFLGIHLLPSFSGIRAELLEKYGEKRYKGLYSLVAAIGLILIIMGMIYRDFVHLWVPPVWGRHAAIALMLPALILLGAANAPTNIKRFTRHPMLWGVTLWACAHLLANGDLASLILFGSFGIYSLFDMWSANRRGAEKSTEIYPISKDLKVIGMGVVVYVGLLLAHPYIIGVPVLIF